MQPADIWDEQLSPLFNDESFTPPDVDRSLGLKFWMLLASTQPDLFSSMNLRF